MFAFDWFNMSAPLYVEMLFDLIPLLLVDYEGMSIAVGILSSFE